MKWYFTLYNMSVIITYMQLRWPFENPYQTKPAKKRRTDPEWETFNSFYKLFKQQLKRCWLFLLSLNTAYLNSQSLGVWKHVDCFFFCCWQNCKQDDRWWQWKYRDLTFLFEQEKLSLYLQNLLILKHLKFFCRCQSHYISICWRT